MTRNWMEVIGGVFLDVAKISNKEAPDVLALVQMLRTVKHERRCHLAISSDWGNQSLCATASRTCFNSYNSKLSPQNELECLVDS